MSYSSVGWNSGLIKPQRTDYQFLITLFIDGEDKVYRSLCQYNPEIDGFTDLSINRTYPRKGSVTYWAYVPKVLDLKREGKQSQVPEER